MKCASSVAVGVIYHSGIEDLGPCLESIRRQTVPCDIYVRDNGSDPGAVDRVVQTHPGVRILRDGINRGFAGGANDIIRSSSASFVLVMNPDVRLSKDCARNLLSVMEADPRIGVAGGKLVREDKTLDSAGIFSSPSRRPLNRGEGEPDLDQFPLGEVLSVTGAAMLLRRDMLEDVSKDGEFFDSDFFIYREDTDLCRRARHLGWRVVYVPGAVATHRRAWRKGTRQGMPRLARFHALKNRYLEMIKNETLGAIGRDLPQVAMFELAQFVYVLLREPSLLGAYGFVLRSLPKTWMKRRAIMARRVGSDEWLRWRISHGRS